MMLLNVGTHGRFVSSCVLEYFIVVFILKFIEKGNENRSIYLITLLCSVCINFCP